MKAKKTNTLIRIILLVLISVIIGVGIYTWNAQSLSGNVMPMPFGVGVGVVLSGSMEPELSIDDVIFVVKDDSYEVGETVVYQDGHMMVVHKIISIEDGMVTTQGTANNTPDEPMKMEYIKGRVLFSVPKLGVAVSALKTPAATLVMLGAAVLLLIRSYRKEDTGEQAELERIREEIERLKEENKDKK